MCPASRIVRKLKSLVGAPVTLYDVTYPAGMFGLRVHAGPSISGAPCTSCVSCACNTSVEEVLECHPSERHCAQRLLDGRAQAGGPVCIVTDHASLNQGFQPTASVKSPAFTREVIHSSFPLYGTQASASPL